MFRRFKDHDEVPILLRNYMMAVTETPSFDAISLDDVNDFLEGLEESQNYFEKDKISA
jgi:hypothetical protein